METCCKTDVLQVSKVVLETETKYFTLLRYVHSQLDLLLPYAAGQRKK